MCCVCTYNRSHPQNLQTICAFDMCGNLTCRIVLRSVFGKWMSEALCIGDADLYICCLSGSISVSTRIHISNRVIVSAHNCYSCEDIVRCKQQSRKRQLHNVPPSAPLSGKYSDMIGRHFGRQFSKRLSIVGPGCTLYLYLPSTLYGTHVHA